MLLYKAVNSLFGFQLYSKAWFKFGQQFFNQCQKYGTVNIVLNYAESTAII